MARKVTEETCKAFDNSYALKCGNTAVTVDKHEDGHEVVCMRLHGNLIARKDKGGGRRQITSAGWSTATTKERLNGLHGVSIVQKAGVWFLNGKEWNGDWIDV